MPLTPTDVANKQFRIAFRGYSLDEVDAFLDEVETELTRLLRDNAGLKTQAPSAAAPTPVEAPAEAPMAPLVGMEGQEAALRTLLLAQRTADEAIAEARAEAEDILAAARADADRTLSGAQEEAERTLSSSTQRAAGLDKEIATKIEQATGDLDARRRALEERIEELRACEREYRTRLKAYLQGQLREIDSGVGAPEDGGAGVPAGARAAAVGAQPPTVAAAPAPALPAVPDGPPREPSSQRAVPPLASTGPEPVGPFTVVPSSGEDQPDPGDPPSGHR